MRSLFFSRTHLVLSELREQIGIVGQGFNRHPDTVDIDAQQLRPIGREGDLLDPIGFNETEKIAVPDGCRTVRAHLQRRQIDGEGRWWWW